MYIHSYANSIEQAESEARHVLRLIEGYNLSYPIYLDLEESGTETGVIQRAGRFGDLIEEAGHFCGIYSNLNWWNTHLSGLERFTKWIAQYNATFDYTGTNKDVWQYSNSGQVNGISGNVDMNECYRDFPAEIKGGEATAPKPQRRTYTVQSGDTLSEIAAKDGTTYQRLAQINNISNLDLIYPGQVIKIE